MGRVIHGNENFGYAPIVETSGVLSFGTPVMLPGMVSATAEVEQSTTNIYADDKAYCVLRGAKARTLNATFRYISDAYAQMLGYASTGTKGMLADTGITPMHCVFFETLEEDCATGEKTRTLHYFYSVKGKEPALETASDEEEVTAEEISVDYDCTNSEFVDDTAGESVQYAYVTRTTANSTWYDGFTSAVLLPTD